jgi:hypothetical protein
MKKILTAFVIMGCILSGCADKVKVVEKAAPTVVDAGTSVTQVTPPVVGPVQSPAEQVSTPKQTVEQK